MVSSRIPNEDAANPIVARRDEILAPGQGSSTPTLINMADKLRECKNCPGQIAVTYLPRNGAGDPYSYDLDLCNSCSIRILNDNKRRIGQGLAGLHQRELPVDGPCVLMCGRSSPASQTDTKCCVSAKLKQCDCDRGPRVGYLASCIDCLSEMKCCIKGCDNKCCITAAKAAKRLCEDHFQQRGARNTAQQREKRTSELISTGAAIATKSGKIMKKPDKYTHAEEKAIKRLCMEQWVLSKGRFRPPTSYKWKGVMAHKDVSSLRGSKALGNKLRDLLKKESIDTKNGLSEEAYEKYRRALE